MIEPSQILLFAVVISLTVLMMLIGWQIFQILSEIRKMLIKTNRMMDNAVSISNSLGNSFQKLSGFSEGLKAILGIFSFFNRKNSSRDLHPEGEKET